MKWFFVPEQRSAARLRCICLPWAGAGAAAFRDWPRFLPDEIEVAALQLPGRGWRLQETPGTDLERTADDVAQALEPLLDRPLVLFGHSFGAWLGLLVTRRLEAAGCPPIAFVASGRRGPAHSRLDPPMRHLDEVGFVAEIQRRYGAIHPEILADSDLLELFLPALRADVSSLEDYAHALEPRVACPIVAIGGTDDPAVPVDELFCWADETTGRFDVRTFAGGHFYFQDDPDGLLGWLRREIESEWLTPVMSG